MFSALESLAKEVVCVANAARKYLKNVVSSRFCGESYSGVIDLFTRNL
jgi:hypothetical protein